MNLGESFPEEMKGGFSERNLVQGTVIRKIVDFTDPPKTKYFIICEISKKKDTAVVLINSDVNLNIFHTARDKAQHFKITTAKYSFLKHDSFVFCGELKELSFSVLAEELKENPGFVVGSIEAHDMVTILEKVRTSHTIAPRIKKKFGIIN